MNIIRVRIYLNKKCMWTGYFDNYPTLDELRPHIPDQLQRQYQVQDFIDELDQDHWIITDRPDLCAYQLLRKFGAIIGELQMDEILLAECEGFNPYKTETSCGV